MRPHSLPKQTSLKNKVKGRGIGSGKGKTAGRGMKGANARGNMPLGFIGGTLALYKRLPLKRGWGNRKVSTKFLPVNINRLASLKTDTKVNLQSLVDNAIIPAKVARKQGVKLVGRFDLKVKLNVLLPTSQSAKESIVKAGGTVGG